MTRKKKILCFSLAVVLLLAVIAYFVANGVLDRVSRQAMAQLATEAQKRGVEISHPAFDGVKLSGFLSATWSDLSASVKMLADDAPGRGRVWEAQVERLAVDWDIGNEASLVAEAITLIGSEADSDNNESSDRRIEVARLQCQFPLELLDAKSSIQELLPKVVQLLADGNIDLPLEVDGKIMFSLQNQPAQLRLFAKQDGATAIILDRNDVASLSARFEEKLTDAEVDIIAKHPLRAPRLLEIKDDAESTSARASQADEEVPQDAYRHILWSYLLTQAYGAEFAEQVGDAHEQGDTGNTQAEREMDLHNNAIGRKYSDEGVSRRAVLNRLLADPNVRQTP